MITTQWWGPKIVSTLLPTTLVISSELLTHEFHLRTWWDKIFPTCIWILEGESMGKDLGFGLLGHKLNYFQRQFFASIRPLCVRVSED